MQLVQMSCSQFIHLLSTLFPHAVSWIRATSCSQIQHEKIQVNFLYSQLDLKAVTSHLDQFITSVFVLPWPYCVKNRLGNIADVWHFCDELTAYFAVQLFCTIRVLFYTRNLNKSWFTYLSKTAVFGIHTLDRHLEKFHVYSHVK